VQRFYPMLMALGLAMLLALAACGAPSRAVRCSSKLERINPDSPAKPSEPSPSAAQANEVPATEAKTNEAPASEAQADE
jgi:hypothetical protein